MAEAVRSNPNVLAARQAARFRHEELPLALSAWRPTVEASVTASRTRIGSAPVASVTDVRIPVFADDGSLVGRTPVLPVPVSGGVSSDHDGREALELVLTQNLYRGGGRKAVLGHAEEVVRLGHADVEDAEQQVLLRTATVYLDVLRAEGFVALREASLAAFEAHARDTRAQYRVGDRTRADVAQAEAERDVAEVAAAQADLEVQRARFETLVGLPPEDLEAPGEPDGLPETLEAARRAAESERPVGRASVRRGAFDRSFATNGSPRSGRPCSRPRAHGATCTRPGSGPRRSTPRSRLRGSPLSASGARRRSESARYGRSWTRSGASSWFG